jgi:multidrug efflux system outer membrane protein
MRRPNLALPLLVLALAGCAVGPDYRRPQVDLADRYREQRQAEAASFADRPWWDVFADPALKGLVGEALERNYDVRAAAQRVEEYRARAGIDQSGYLPTVTPGAGLVRGRNPASAYHGGSTGQQFSLTAALSWELDLWGRIRRLNEASRANFLASQEARRGVFLATAAQVAQAYFELRELDSRLEIARSATQAFQETWDLFNRRLTGGTASALETARAEAARDAAAAAIPDLERQIQAKENLLCFLVGRGPGPIPRGAALASQPLPPAIPAGLPSALLERRPDLRQAELQLVAANAAVGVAQANRLPTLSLTGLYGGASSQLSSMFGLGKEWNLGANLSGPALQGRKLTYQKQVAVAQWEQARTRYEGAVTSAFGEVSTQLAAYGKLADAEEQQGKAVAAYREAVRLASLRYRAGLSGYMEVLEAQQQLFPAENARSLTRLARLTAMVNLYKALGGGWNLQDPANLGAWAKQP